MEFQISEELRIPVDYDDKDFLQFVWLHNRILKRMKEKSNTGYGLQHILGH